MTSTDTHLRPELGSAQPHCFLCGSLGHFIHHDLNDRLFGAGGSWNFKACFNPSCQLIWLDPTPSEEELESAYSHYYTHDSHPHAGTPHFISNFYHTCRNSYWARKYNYPPPTRSSLSTTLSSLPLYLAPLRRRRADADIRYLQAIPNGRLLDVGCGAGHWIETMRNLGWTVHGVDFDATAVKLANQKGLSVQCGSLEQQNYPDACFDAITLNHVIEHLPDPVRTLKECARLLKPGGTLVVLTPNGASLGHHLFRGKWRGLEPPRHLQIFTAGSLDRILDAAGFSQPRTIPQVVWSIISESVLLQSAKPGSPPGALNRWLAWTAGHLIGSLEWLLLPFAPNVADCLISIAIKHPTRIST